MYGVIQKKIETIIDVEYICYFDTAWKIKYFIILFHNLIVSNFQFAAKILHLNYFRIKIRAPIYCIYKHLPRKNKYCIDVKKSINP